MSSLIIHAENSADIQLLEQMAQRLGLACIRYNTETKTIEQDDAWVHEFAGMWENMEPSAEELIKLIEESRTSSTLKSL